ncbi:MAG: acyl-CoA desaturase [Planctomycetes bacterium]|nr:acyl-CoA desaturase [Planctomycetota bacterium]MBI3833928.1 acyl-CoA desaturase [Planctomycetota bacterium]
MYVKTAMILAWLAASYTLLVFGMGGIWAAIPLAISLGLSMAAVGFNIQHDGGHHAYSNRPWVNKVTAMTLDLLGGSSYIWARKHNSIHHSFSNITGEDDDINLGVLGRLSPHQKRFWFHRFQHFYLWILYGFLPAKWQILDDFVNVAVGKIGAHRLPRPKGWDLVTFIGGKAVFFTLAFVIPFMLHPWWYVLMLYFVVTYFQGLVLSVVFQLAHAVEDAEFPMPDKSTGRMEKSWAEHQVETTVDFARGNRLLSWYIGGLNFQIEHHLFAQVCHIHYPALAPVIENTCKEFGIRYTSHRTFRQGVRSHFRWLRRMGRQD